MTKVRRVRSLLIVAVATALLVTLISTGSVSAAGGAAPYGQQSVGVLADYAYCQTGTVPAGHCNSWSIPADSYHHAIWWSVSPGPDAPQCNWIVRDVNNWVIVGSGTAWGHDDGAIPGLYSEYRIELVWCPNLSWGDIRTFT
jgi:hypothetical protein